MMAPARRPGRTQALEDSGTGADTAGPDGTCRIYSGAGYYGFPSEGVLGVLGVLFLCGGGGCLWLWHLPESLQERRDLLLLLEGNLEAGLRRVGPVRVDIRFFLLLQGLPG